MQSEWDTDKMYKAKKTAGYLIVAGNPAAKLLALVRWSRD